MQTFPRKSSQLSTQVGTEVVLFKQESGQAICLNQVSSVIWNLCVGRSSVAEIAEAATLELQRPVSEEIVEFALLELSRKGLLQQAHVATGAMLSRRTLVQRLGSTAALLLPIVSLVAIPKQAHASGGGCVPGDTPIQLADGGLIPMSAVRPGMWLRAFDADSGTILNGQVDQVNTLTASRIHTLFTEQGNVLQSSSSHLLIAGPGNVDGTPVAHFKAGDALMVYDVRQNCVASTRLTGVAVSEVARTVYGIEMASIEHTYVSAGLVSHNQIIKDLNPGTVSQWQEQARVKAQVQAQVQAQAQAQAQQSLLKDGAQSQADPAVGWEFDR